MDKFLIEGGRKLSGRVRVAGAKNAVLPILTASLLAEKGQTIVRNVPDIADITYILKVLENLGARVERSIQERIVTIDAQDLSGYVAPYDLVRKMRASFLVMGPLLARLGQTQVSLPGGCVLGPRPVNLHLEGFRRLGAQIEEEHGYVRARAQRLKGGIIPFDRPTHTGTENILMAASLASGKTKIINAATDPEVVDLASFLNQMGAKISGAGTNVIEVEGVSQLEAVDYSPMGDRLEAGTYLMAGSITGGKVKVEGARADHLRIVLHKLEGMSVKTEEGNGWITAQGPRRLSPINILTYPYPGFPTDLQPSIMALAAVASGTSYIRETVFQERFSQVMELIRLGADIRVSGNEATVFGREKLEGASLMCSDIRAGASLVLAGLRAEGTTEILRVYHIDRGYERMEEKLKTLGAKIERVNSDGVKR